MSDSDFEEDQYESDSDFERDTSDSDCPCKHTVQVIIDSDSIEENLEGYIIKIYVYSAYKLGLIGREEILKYLQENTVTPLRLLAYQHLLLHDIDQYIDGEHFLVKAPMDYGALYMIKYEDGDTHLARKDGEEKLDFLYKSVLKLAKDKEFKETVKLLAENIDSVSPGNIHLAINARNASALKFDQYQIPIFIGLIASDWFEPVKMGDTTFNIIKIFYRPNLFSSILDICQDKKKFPRYWGKISPQFRSLIEGYFFTGSFIPDFSIPEKIMDLFPDFFSFPKEKLNKVTWYIYQLPLFSQGYILGYPFHITNPVREELLEKLFYITEVGFDKYADEVREKNKKYWETFGKEFANEEDSLGKDIFSYSPFDVVGISNKDKIWFFTRPEFDDVLGSNKNLITHSDLQLEERIPIVIRNKIAKDYALFPSQPMKVLFQAFGED